MSTLLDTRTNAAPVVALDIGNVCFRLQPKRCSTMLGFDAEKEIYTDRPNVLQLIESYETGRICCDDFFEKLRRQAARNLEIETIKNAWHNLIGEEISGMKDIIDEFRESGLSVVFFSNISVTHFEVVRRRLSFIDKIDGAVLSFEIGHVKPNCEIFKVMERRFCKNRPPTLYLDDKIENIVTAKSRGWNSHLVENVDGIRSKLA